MSFGDALAIYNQRLAGDGSLKPRSKFYLEEPIAALLKSWPSLAKTDSRKISKTDCLTWAADFGQKVVCIRHELALQPAWPVYEEYADPKEGKVKLDGDTVIEFHKLPEMKQVTLKVLRWEEQDKRLVIKEAQMVA
jgi:hypothetical protein